MPEYKANKEAVEMAKRRIDDGEYDLETEWSDAAPSADEGNAVIEDAGYDEYGSWHLGIDTSASEETKDRFGFPYGDFSKVNRAALVHAKQRASQNDHDEIMDVSDEAFSISMRSAPADRSEVGRRVPVGMHKPGGSEMETNKRARETGEEQLRVGECYEFTHGPASAPERTMSGVLEKIDTVSSTYTFRVDDGSTISLVDHEVDGARLVSRDC